MLAHKKLFQLPSPRYISPDPAELITQNRKNQQKVWGTEEKYDRITTYSSFITLFCACHSSFIYSQITLKIFKALTLISQTKYIYHSLWSLFSHSLKSPTLNIFYLAKLARTSWITTAVLYALTVKSIYTRNKDTKSVKNSSFPIN